MVAGVSFLRTRATIKPVQPATVAMTPSVSNVRYVNKSSKLFNCERNEPVCTDIKLYGAMPKMKENYLTSIKLFSVFSRRTDENRKEKYFFRHI